MELSDINQVQNLLFSGMLCYLCW